MFVINKKRQHKPSKFLFYVKGVFHYYFPSFKLRCSTQKRLAKYSTEDQEDIWERVRYYNKLEETVTLSKQDTQTLPEIRIPKKRPHNKTYYYDIWEFLREYPKKWRIAVRFGDVTTIPEIPAFVKSRPIASDNANSVVFKLDKMRHFNFLKDGHSYESKQDKMVGRGVMHTKRIPFFDLYFNHPLCDIGEVKRHSNDNYKQEWIKNYMSLEDHLDYKFILCIEGVDVATNLKWTMSSNSIAVMPEPKYETWYMEGKLIPNYHYICIKQDFSDFEERIEYYLAHPNEAKEIIQHAQEWVAQFQDKKKERLIGDLVMETYHEKVITK